MHMALIYGGSEILDADYDEENDEGSDDECYNTTKLQNCVDRSLIYVRT